MHKGIPVDLGVVETFMIVALAFATVFFAIWSTCTYSDTASSEWRTYLKAQLVAALLWFAFAAADFGAIVAIIAWRG